MHCTNCDELISDDGVRWANEEPYCEECFDELYNYCSRCDAVIRRESTLYDSSGDPLCSECWEDNVDDDCPDNPPVSESDRELVIKLSRSWLQGKVETRRPIFINDKDILLRTIKDKVGLVDTPVYLFGLVDRQEYQISASSDLFEPVQQYILINNIPVTVVSTPGCNRLGISLSLRKNYQKEIVELIKSVTAVKETVPA
ncbi:MAG: hypothetical protein DAHOPDDO_00780 [Ignavibacteriaceae bacterium]|nr:hypothetical protein [Ignavibacteriaceae bacterium]